jgi:hypothetical protein
MDLLLRLMLDKYHMQQINQLRQLLALEQQKRLEKLLLQISNIFFFIYNDNSFYFIFIFFFFFFFYLQAHAKNEVMPMTEPSNKPYLEIIQKNKKFILFYLKHPRNR